MSRRAGLLALGLAHLASHAAAAPAAFTLTPADDGPVPTVTVEAGGRAITGPVWTPEIALAMLADTRFAGAWPGLARFAGPGLSGLERASMARSRAEFDKLRRRVVGRALLAPGAARPEAGLSGDVPVAVDAEAALHMETATLQDALGDSAGAARTLADLRASAAFAGMDAFSRSMTAIREARLRARGGDVAGARGLYERALAEFPVGSDYGTNVAVNLAALLAETGEGGRALTLLDAVGDPHARRLDDTRARVLPTGADQLDWIRACALARAGRSAEARAVWARFVAGAAVTPAARRRGAVCVGDAGALADVLAAELTGPGPLTEGALLLQPAFIAAAPPRWRDALTAAKARPDVGAAYAMTQRDLPAEYAGDLRRLARALH